MNGQVMRMSLTRIALGAAVAVLAWTAALRAGELRIAGEPIFYPPGISGGLCDAADVNSTGTAVGYAHVAFTQDGILNCAVRWDASGVGVELGHLGTDSNGLTDAEASGINNAGTAVGYAWNYVDGDKKGSRAVRWDAGGTAAVYLDLFYRCVVHKLCAIRFGD